MPPDAARDPLIGSVLERRYELIAALGRGGMGTVYLAEDTRLKRRYALKVLRPDLACDRVFVERFLREAQTIAQLEHPNIVNIHSFGEDPSGIVFFTMELLAGEDLDARIKAQDARPYSTKEALAWAIQIARAMAAVHDGGLIHRDLKPANVFLTRRPDGQSVVKILDFGIARPETASDLTRTGMALGTPSHMSPEQCETKKVDRRSDIYSFGVLLFKLLTGRLPFIGEPVQVAIQHCLTPPPVPSSLSPAVEIPPDLDALILQMMAKKPDDRPTSMHEVERALVAIHDTIKWEPVAVPPGAAQVAINRSMQRAVALAETIAAAVDEEEKTTAAVAPVAPVRVAERDATPAQSSRPQDTYSGAPSAPTSPALASVVVPEPRRQVLRFAIPGIAGLLALLTLLLTMPGATDDTAPPRLEIAEPAVEPPPADPTAEQPPSPGPVAEAPPPPLDPPPVLEAKPEDLTGPEPPKRPPEAKPKAVQEPRPRPKPKPKPKPPPDVKPVPPPEPPKHELPPISPSQDAKLKERARACRKKHKAEGGAPILLHYAITDKGAARRIETTSKTALADCLIEALKETQFEPVTRLEQSIKL